MNRPAHSVAMRSATPSSHALALVRRSVIALARHLRDSAAARRRAVAVASLLVAAAFGCRPALATCTQGSAGIESFSITLPASVTIPRDAAVGSVIAQGSQSIPFSTANPMGVYCTTSANVVYTNLQGGQSSNGVMPIGSTGLGYRLVTSGTTFSTGTQTLPAADFTAADCPHPSGNTCYRYLSDGPLSFQLVKLQPIVSNQLVPAGQYYSVTIGGLADSMVALANAVKLTSQTCAVTTPSVPVNLGETRAAQFSGVGSAAGTVPFTIGVDCTGLPTTVAVTFTDQNNPGNTSNTLPLTATSTASGVGIQILRNGTPVNFGADSSTAGNPNQVVIGASNSAPMNIAFGGRYVQTAAVIRPGSANGVATFTMSYQ